MPNRTSTRTRTATARLSSADHTRQALIHAALQLFGEKGYDATSTREIAAAANANIGSIAYHFGGKDGLRLACAEFIIDTIRNAAGAALGGDPLNAEAASDPQAAREQLTRTIEAMIGFIVARPEAGEIVQFVLREMQHPTAALDTIYNGVFEPVHKALCRVWENATGEPAESERTRITVFTLIGQAVYFRIGREAVKRRMGWADIGPRQVEAVVEVARDNVAAILDARQEHKP